MNFEVWICCVLSEEMSFDFFLPYGLMLTKMKKKSYKLENFKF